MNIFANKRKKRILIVVLSVIIILVIMLVACAIYLSDYYRADKNAIDAYEPENKVAKQVLENDNIIYTPENVEAGFIFYPGGKVEYIAYEPLMEALASEGIMCVLIEMPFNLAVFDIDAADGIPEQYPEVDKWYIGGHSLGGSMAASYLSDEEDKYAGLILLGSYSTADLSADSFEVLSIYGSEDQVLNHKKYIDNKDNLPDDFNEIVINGGCHAYFGMYGAQDGDGIPTISNVDQIEFTANEICRFVFN